MESAEKFSRPLLLDFMNERALLAQSSPPSPILTMEEDGKAPLTRLSLDSLNGLMPNSSPKEHNKNNNQSDSGTLILFSTDDHSVVSQESALVLPQKIDQGSTPDSKKGITLFGVWMKSDDSSNSRSDKQFESKRVSRSDKQFESKRVYGNQERAKKRHAEGLLGLESGCLPDKKRATIQRMNANNMRKVLTKSDVNQSCRLLLGKKPILVDRVLRDLNLCAEKFEKSDHGEEVKVFDLDIEREATLMLKRWRTNSFLLNHGWTENFVTRRNLHQGDEIELAWDETTKRLNFSVVKRALPKEH